MPQYFRPAHLEDALAALNAGRWTILAGGTDFYPARVGRPLDDDVLDISGLEGLRAIEERDDHWRLPALATWTDVLRAHLPPWFDGLKAAAREIGGAQIQNVGTVCGNICNASPAADGIPVLLSLDATVEIASASAQTLAPLGALVRGNRETVLASDQMVLGVRIPKPAGTRAGGAFLKLGARRYLVISIVMAAAALEVDAAGRVARAAVSLGACSPVARRLQALEDALVGRPCDGTLGAAAEARHLAGLAPIDDVRGSAAYRGDAALTVTRRVLAALGARLGAPEAASP